MSAQPATADPNTVNVPPPSAPVATGAPRPSDQDKAIQEGAKTAAKAGACACGLCCILCIVIPIVVVVIITIVLIVVFVDTAEKVSDEITNTIDATKTIEVAGDKTCSELYEGGEPTYCSTLCDNFDSN